MFIECYHYLTSTQVTGLFFSLVTPAAHRSHLLTQYKPTATADRFDPGMEPDVPDR